VILCDILKQDCYEKITVSSKGFAYKYLVNDYSLNYLRKAVKFIYLKEIAKIRMSAHDLNIECGRYRNTERSNRICTLCDLNDIEDGLHFIRVIKT